MSIAYIWRATESETSRRYPCDERSMPGAVELFRAVDIDAPAAIAFRRLCHLRVAPYSYDWLDNGGRRSPRDLVPGVDSLAAGQRVMRIFSVENFSPGEQLTIRLTHPKSRNLFGEISLTYAVVPVSPSRCRLVTKLRCCTGSGFWGRVRTIVMPWIDLFMMRKQLLNLASLAKRDALLHYA